MEREGGRKGREEGELKEGAEEVKKGRRKRGKFSEWRKKEKF